MNEYLYGVLSQFPTGYVVLAALIIVGVLGFTGAPLWLWIILGVPLLILSIPPLRKRLVTPGLMKMLAGFMPKLSPTEQQALESGTVWVEGEFFKGKPDFDRIKKEPFPTLSEEEKAFLDGPVEELCKMVDDWEVMVNKDLPPEAWEYIKKEKFWGLIIPKEYGGLDFSASAHSEIISKLASRSLTLAITVMVPNSLGPAELLIHYGTEEQKKYYLPRLASGARPVRMLPPFNRKEWCLRGKMESCICA